MNLRDFEYVIALAETGHFGQAAARCHVTQPTLSTQVAKLEDSLGVQIFERGKRRVFPTKAGEAIVAQTRTVLNEVRRLEDMARQPGYPLGGPFRLGAIPTVGPYLLPHLLPILRTHYSELKLFVSEHITERLVEMLLSTEVDAAILSLPLEEPGLDQEAIMEEEFVAALPPDHPLAAKKTLQEADLVSTDLLLLAEGHCMRRQTLKICQAYREKRYPFQASSIESLRQMVASGAGSTLLPTLAARGPFAETRVEIRPLQPPTPRRTLVLAWRSTFPKVEAMRALAELLRRELKGLGTYEARRASPMTNDQ